MDCVLCYWLELFGLLVANPMPEIITVIINMLCLGGFIKLSGIDTVGVRKGMLVFRIFP